MNSAQTRIYKQNLNGIFLGRFRCEQQFRSIVCAHDFFLLQHILF